MVRCACLPPPPPIDSIPTVFLRVSIRYLTRIEYRHTHWPDHISSDTLERMCLALSNRTVSGQLAFQYALCVLYKAIIHISRWLRSCSSQALSNCLERSRKSYITTSLRYLSDIDFTRSPSLPMIQAFLSGVSTDNLPGT